MKKYTMFKDQTLKIIKTPIISKLIFRINAIPIKHVLFFHSPLFLPLICFQCYMWKPSLLKSISESVELGVGKKQTE